MKPTKCPATEKKNKERKEKEVGRRESEKKVKSFLCMPKLHITEYFVSGSGGRKVYDL